MERNKDMVRQKIGCYNFVVVHLYDPVNQTNNSNKLTHITGY